MATLIDTRSKSVGKLIFTIPCQKTLPESSLIESVKRQTNAHHDENVDGQHKTKG